MKRFRVKLTAVILIVATLLSFSTHLYAAEGKYLCDIRLIMAESLDAAKKQLESSIYRTYTLYPYDLNEGNGKYFGITDVDMGVYIAYTTTDNVDEAITDIAVMDMNGGYQEGNMQAALAESMKQYIKLAEKYLKVAEHMLEGVEAGDPLCSSALRQLNIYYDSIAKKRLGDMLEEGMSAQALATLLLKANTHVVSNIRSLFAMGASYNVDGESYLDKVASAAAKYDADPTVYDSENWYELAISVEGTIGVLRDRINEYRYAKDELDYDAEEWGEKEIEHLEEATIAILFEKVDYINGKDLADFIVEYQIGGENYKQLYPLVAALNPAQKALTELCQFYDVVRYEGTLLSEELTDEQIKDIEDEWPNGFDIYLGVDLGMYDSTFAVTTEADRSAATAGRDITSEVFFRTNAIVSYFVNGFALVSDVAIYAFRLYNAKKTNAALDASLKLAREVSEKAEKAYTAVLNDAKYYVPNIGTTGNMYPKTLEQMLVELAKTYNVELPKGANFHEALSSFMNNIKSDQLAAIRNDVVSNDMYSMLSDALHPANMAEDCQYTAAENARKAALAHKSGYVSVKGMTMTFSGVMLCIMAYQIGTWVYNYYNPQLADIPSDIVDVIATDNGDRYIHYVAAENITPNDKGEYKPVCLNAFEGSKWIALYYTKSYEAGNALLAEFSVSESSNVAPKDFIPVNKFGDSKSFDLNTHAFRAKKSVYLSVAASDDAKTYVTDVPVVVGAMLGIGKYFIAATAGAGIAAVSVLAVGRAKKNKAKESDSTAA